MLVCAYVLADPVAGTRLAEQHRSAWQFQEVRVAYCASRVSQCSLHSLPRWHHLRCTWIPNFRSNAIVGESQLLGVPDHRIRPAEEEWKRPHRVTQNVAEEGHVGSLRELAKGQRENGPGGMPRLFSQLIDFGACSAQRRNVRRLSVRRLRCFVERSRRLRIEVPSRHRNGTHTIRRDG